MILTLAKGTALVSLLFLIPLPAWAECAWVLWLEQTLPIERISWTPVAAAPNSAGCRQELTAAIKAQSDPKPGETIEVRTNMISVKSESIPLMILRYVCLPDTVDPRGPKGGPQ